LVCCRAVSAHEPAESPHAAAAARPSWFDVDDAPATPDLNTCIHCGLCLTACPTYRTLKIEPDSPRGRLYLMRGLAEGRIAPSDPLVGHLDLCLDCRACETVCPAGVPYSRLLEATRGQIARRWRPASPLRMLGHWVLRHVLPHAGRVEFAVDLLRIGQQAPIAGLLASPLGRALLPAIRKAGAGDDAAPPAPPRASARAGGAAPARRRAHGAARGGARVPSGRVREGPRGVPHLLHHAGDVPRHEPRERAPARARGSARHGAARADLLRRAPGARRPAPRREATRSRERAGVRRVVRLHRLELGGLRRGAARHRAPAARRTRRGSRGVAVPPDARHRRGARALQPAGARRLRCARPPIRRGLCA